MSVEQWYPRESEGTLVYDPLPDTKHFEPWWSLLRCDEEIRGLHIWLAKRHGLVIRPNKLWGCHVSFIKGEEPRSKDWWGCNFTIRYRYSPVLRCENGCHAWLDVYSVELAMLRLRFGLRYKEKYHMTLGRVDGCNDGE